MTTVIEHPAFERSMSGLVSLEVVSHARFVRLYGRHGYE